MPQARALTTEAIDEAIAKLKRQRADQQRMLELIDQRIKGLVEGSITPDEQFGYVMYQQAGLPEEALITSPDGAGPLQCAQMMAEHNEGSVKIDHLARVMLRSRLAKGKLRNVRAAVRYRLNQSREWQHTGNGWYQRAATPSSPSVLN